MADESDNRSLNSASPATESTVKEQMGAKADFPSEKSDTSVFINSEPMREDQVQNAVKFLSHPKVQGSPIMYRRSFLERKGLTKEEIDEAFRRVPDPSPSVVPSQPVASQDGQLKSSLPVQQQMSTQSIQPVSVASTGATSKFGTLSRFHWSHALIAVGLLAISGAGTAVVFKNSVIPRLKSWIRKVVLDEEEGEPLVKQVNQKPNIAEEAAAAAAKAAAAAAADVARASQEMVLSKAEEKRYFTELTHLLDVQIHEMKSMSTALQKLEGASNFTKVAAIERADLTASAIDSRQYFSNGKIDNSVYSGTLSPPASVEPSVAPHPKSYMEIMAMVERGEKPSNIRDINDQPPNPNQPVPNPRVVPKPKPWEAVHPQSSSTNGFQYRESSNSFNPTSLSTQSNGDGSAPASFWQQKNARITEIETEDGAKSGSAVYIERPVQRSWVPPQPPPVAMAEAAAAIRQPKKPLLQNEQLTDDQLLSRSTEISDDLQRITRMSETGGGMEANGNAPVASVSEIQSADEEKPYTTEGQVSY